MKSLTLGSRLLIVAASALAINLANSTPLLASSDDAPAFSAAVGACTPNETWKYGKTIPQAWTNKISKFASEEKSAMDLLILAGLMKYSNLNAEGRVLADYWIGRTFYSMKFIHAAHQKFNNLLAQNGTPATYGIQLAALECINQIQNTHATLALQPSTLEALKSLIPHLGEADQKATAWPVVLRSLQFKIGQRPDDPEAGTELALLRGSGVFEKYALMLLAAARSSEDDLIPYATGVLGTDPLPKHISNDLDSIHLMLGRAYYGKGRFDKALEEFSKVRNTSNLIAQALTDMSWALLLSESYSDAVSKSYNLFVGGLRRVFAPEAHLVNAIALNESCNHREALESIRYFLKSYEKTYEWLYQWSNKTRNQPYAEVYPLLSAYLKKSIGVPDPIGTEWLRSPVFIASQQEMNALLDEQDQLRSITSRISRLALSSSKDRRLKPAQQDLLGSLNSLAKRLPEREKALMTQINMDLTTRTRGMLDSLKKSLDTMQLVQAEVYNALGEKVIKDYVQPDADMKDDKGAKGDKKQRKPPVWDWGNFPKSNDKAELWEDELGFLKTEITDKCQ